MRINLTGNENISHKIIACIHICYYKNKKFQHRSRSHCHFNMDLSDDETLYSKASSTFFHAFFFLFLSLLPGSVLSYKQAYRLTSSESFSSSKTENFELTILFVAPPFIEATRNYTLAVFYFRRKCFFFKNKKTQCIYVIKKSKLVGIYTLMFNIRMSSMRIHMLKI